MALEHEGWEVHDQVEHPSHHAASLEEFKGTEEEKEGSYLKQLKEAAEVYEHSLSLSMFSHSCD